MSAHLTSAITIAILAAAIAAALRTRRHTQPTYRARALLTPAEQRFYTALQRAAGDHTHIIGKVRVADLVEISHPKTGKEFWRAFNAISRKHIDFVLCRQETLEVIAAIELNDSSHERPDRKRRDQLVATALRSAGIRLICIKAQAHYSVPDLRKTLSEP